MLKENVYENTTYWYLDKEDNINKVCVLAKYDDYCAVRMKLCAVGSVYVVREVRYENLFESEAIAITERANRIAGRRKTISDEIHSVEDLFKMMLNTMKSAGEYTDDDRIEVAKAKVKELLGIELEEI